jgi:hypothetical protein
MVKRRDNNVEKLIMEVNQSFENLEVKRKRKTEPKLKKSPIQSTPTSNRTNQFYINITPNHQLIEEYLG